MMDSIVFNFNDVHAQQSFIDRCVRDYGIDPHSLYVSKSAGFVVIDRVDPGVVRELSKERGVASVSEDALLDPFL